MGRAKAQAPGTGGPERHTPWLTTSNPDGSAHVMPVGVISVDGAWYFSSGPGTRKSRNLTRDPRCVITVATRPLDLVVEGRAERVIDATELRTVADGFATEGWPASVAGDALTAEFSAPSAGPPPWNVYRLVLRGCTPWAPPDRTAPPDSISSSRQWRPTPGLGADTG